jgi:hypothetical protein
MQLDLQGVKAVCLCLGSCSGQEIKQQAADEVRVSTGEFESDPAAGGSPD